MHRQYRFLETLCVDRQINYAEQVSKPIDVIRKDHLWGTINVGH